MNEADRRERTWSDSFFNTLKPHPRLTVSEWADTYRIIPKPAPEAGKWRTSRTPYLKEIMDAASDPKVNKIVFMASSQIAKSEFLLNVIGYYAHQDPSSMLMVQPHQEALEAFSKERVTPTFNESPVLRKLLRKDEDDSALKRRGRKGNDSIQHKLFDGGFLAFAPATSPASLSSRPVRIVLLDEVDRYTETREGHPVLLAEQRTLNYHNRKIILTSSPTLRGASKIEEEFNQSDMRRFYVPCPHCGEKQILTWGNVRWERTEDGGHLTETAAYYCEKCGAAIDDKHKPDMLLKGQWKADGDFNGTAGFHINALYSPFVKFSYLAAEWVKIHKHFSKEGLMEFVNLKLGETWEEESDNKLDVEYLERRREYYTDELPEGALILTAGVDIQDDRAEIEVVGWSHGKESWGIEYKVIYGDLSQSVFWTELADYLVNNKWSNKERTLKIDCACIDSGGHYTNEVYDFCKKYELFKFFAIKGKGGLGVPIINNPSRSNRRHVALFTVGDDATKEIIFSRLKIEFEGEGYCHFPRHRESGYTETYFKGLLSERRVIRHVKGRPKIEWVKASGARNEPLDCRKYATAAIEILNPNFDLLENRKNAQSMPQKRKRGILSKGI